jgi:hypothetical protein
MPVPNSRKKEQTKKKKTEKKNNELRVKAIKQ